MSNNTDAPRVTTTADVLMLTGDIITEHLDKLREGDQEKLSDAIVAYSDARIALVLAAMRDNGTSIDETLDVINDSIVEYLGG